MKVYLLRSRKIAFVYDVPYPWHTGGLEHILNKEAESLAKNNEVHYFTLKWPGMRRRFTYNHVIYHTYANASEKTTYRHGRRSLREAMKFPFYLLNLFNFKFDVVITDFFPITHLSVIKLYCWLNNCKLILKASEVWDSAYWQTYLGPALGSMANSYSNFIIKSDRAKYIANSSTTAERLTSLGIDKAKISVFSPILDFELFEKAKSLKKLNKKDNILLSCRFIKEKRIDKWLEIVKKVTLRYKKAGATLIGDGVELDQIKRLVKLLDLSNSVTIRPFYKDKMNLYREILESSVVLNMSEREGLSIIAIESVALGTPVVLPDYSPIPKEVRQMCVVEKEENIPNKIIKIMKSRNPKEYVKNTENIKLFSDSKISDFYKHLLDKV